MSKKKGTEDICVDCKKPYIRKARNQKRCTECGLRAGSVRK